jgi:KDO2-lipid IV(A) lauroyltransferase
MRLAPLSRLVYSLLVATIHTLSLIPDSVLYWFGVVGGRLAYALDRRHVKIGMRNLEIAFPQRSVEERRRILRESYINLGRSSAEYVRLGGFFYRRLKDRVNYDRFDYWRDLARRYPGRGLVILSAHLGNFELLAPAHAMHGFQIGLVHHTQRFLAGDALLTFVRERAGVEVLRKHSAARAVIRALRQGEMIGVPFDQNAKRSEAIFVPFFGEMAATTSGLARLAQITNALVVPVFILRQPDKRLHRILIMDALELQNSSDTPADVEENTRRFVAVVEEVVRQYPEQFLWTHRRFRTRPRGAPEIYV